MCCWAASAASWGICSRPTTGSRAARAFSPAECWCGCWIGAWVPSIIITISTLNIFYGLLLWLSKGV
ncbi:MAG: hypothetical protein EGQ75_02735, partial [Clostridiales bacterium]|nr:hypothetical protein [Clostridiales bacterium]